MFASHLTSSVILELLSLTTQPFYRICDSIHTLGACGRLPIDTPLQAILDTLIAQKNRSQHFPSFIREESNNTFELISDIISSTLDPKAEGVLEENVTIIMQHMVTRLSCFNSHVIVTILTICVTLLVT